MNGRFVSGVKRTSHVYHLLPLALRMIIISFYRFCHLMAVSERLTVEIPRGRQAVHYPLGSNFGQYVSPPLLAQPLSHVHLPREHWLLHTIMHLSHSTSRVHSA